VGDFPPPLYCVKVLNKNVHSFFWSGKIKERGERGGIVKQIKFLHTADLHLDSPMVGLSKLPENIYKRLLNSTFIALKRIVDTAIDKQVDFLIVAGDVYDGEDRSIRAQVKFRQEMERLAAHGIPVYLTHGNHDHLSGSWVHIPLPENVYVYGEEVEHYTYTKDNVIANLYGFSYPRRQLFDRKIDEYKKESDADFHIGILHGNEGGYSSHDNYAPFHIKDLIDKQFDYWALGHIHKRNILCENPPIIYPGNIQGRHHKELGPKGCYIVTLAESNCQLEWFDTADVEWDSVDIDVQNISSFQSIYQLCTGQLSQIRNEQSNGKIVKLELRNFKPFEGSTSILNGELLEILQENESEEENFVWVSAIQVKEELLYDLEILKSEEGFVSELLNTIESYDQSNEALAALFNHPQARRHLSDRSIEEQSNIVKEAERILLQLLM
jgi:DNA repair protein SbcD/Mre11